MIAYIIRRLILIIPTVLGILTINFFIIQAAPGGPVEQVIARLQGTDVSATARISGAGQDEVVSTKPTFSAKSKYRGAQGLDPELIKDIEKLYGFDQPIHIRFLKMLKNYARFDMGDSFFRDQSVIRLIISKMPVSISLGIWSTLLIYSLSIPLGIRKAVKHGSRFDVWSSTAVIIGNAVPVFLFAIILIVLFAGGSYFDWFPLRGLTSDNFSELSLPGKIGDYFWHLALPILAMVIGGFATLTCSPRILSWTRSTSSTWSRPDQKGLRKRGCCTATCSETPC